MIQATPEAYKELVSPSFRLKTKVTWRLDRSTSGGIDITERVTSISTVRYSMGQFLGPFEPVGLSMTIANDDERFTTGKSGGYIEGGPADYYLTELSIQQGPVLPDGSVEYKDVYTPRIQNIIPNKGAGTVELQLIGPLGVMDLTPLPEDFSFGSESGLSDLYEPIEDVLKELADFTFLDSATIFKTTSPGWEQINDWLIGSGWPIVGSVRRNESVADVAAELAKSCLATLVETEDGKLDLLPRLLPRVFGATMVDIDIPDPLDDLAGSPATNFVEGVQLSASEVNAEYAGTAMKYRDATAESVGRIPKVVSLGFARLAYQAAYAARLIQEHHAPFPKAIVIEAPGIGLLAQLGDRFKARNPAGEMTTWTVVEKMWQPGTVVLRGMENPAESSIFELDTEVFGTATWGDTAL